MPSPRARIAEHIGILLVIAFMIGVVWSAMNGGVSSGHAAARTASAPLPMDDAFTSDTLANGLRYFVATDDNPGKTVELRLVVDAGSAMETDQQRGLAHAVEHMAFRGTRRFRHEALVQWLHGIGLRDGDDLNAFTSRDETTFRLTIPLDRPGALDRAFDVMEDWASAVTFDPQDAAREREVILAEARDRSGVGDRLDDARDSLFLGRSRYAMRDPIGARDVIEKFDPAQMRAFYERWYHPELMTVVAVGDLSRDSLQKLVEKHFAHLPRGSVARPDLSVGVPSHFHASVLRDPEADAVTLAFYHLATPAPHTTVGDARRSCVTALYDDMLARRLDRLTAGGAPVNSIDVDEDRIVRPLEAAYVQAELPARRATQGIDTVLAEIARVAKAGFTHEELALAERSLRASAERRLDAGEEQPSSDSRADDVIDHVTEGTSLVSNGYRDSLTLALLDSVTLADVNALAHARLGRAGGWLVLTAPDDTPLPDERALDLADSLARARPVVPFLGDSTVTSLGRAPANTGAVVATRVHHDIGVTEWVLSNGMHVLLKPTSFRSDEILFDAVAPGGASLADDAHFGSAYEADRILEATGVGTFTPSALDRALDGQPVDLSPTVYQDRVTLTGSATSQSVETLLQLARLYFTAPRPDTAAFQRYRARRIDELTSDAADPESQFDDSVAAILAQHSPRAGRETVARMRALDLGAALDFWRARMANASNFTVIFVGNTSEDRLRPLVERYLGTLPAGHGELPLDRGPHVPTHAITARFRAGTGDRAQASITYTGAYPSSAEDVATLGVLREIVANAMDARLRGELGGTYGVDVDARGGAMPREDLELSIAFTAAPARVDSLVAAADSVMRRIVSKGPTAAELESVRHARLRDLRDDMQRNNWWSDELLAHTARDWSLATIPEHEPAMEHLTLAAVRDLASRLIDPNRRVVVIRLPRQAAPATRATAP